MIAAVVCALKGPATVDADWGVVNSTTPVTSPTRTLSIPGGTRSLDFNITLNSMSGAVEYQKNGGAWTTVTDGLDVDFASGDTLAFRGDGVSAEGVIIVVTDNVFSTTVGTFNGTID